MATIASVVDLVYPTVSGLGLPTNSPVWVLFDREIDETTVAGHLFVAGPDFDTWSGPDLQLFLDATSTGTEDEILQSPAYHGIVQGVFSYQRLDPSSMTVISGLDTVGSGLIYRTKAIFTPSIPLQTETEYTVYLAGDDSDTDTVTDGISTRSVFDPVANPANTGTATVTFTGGYNGLLASDTFTIAITTGGEAGTARFSFSRTSEPGTTYGPFKTKLSGVFLADGVTAVFGAGTFAIGDSWTVLVKEPVVFTGRTSWPFKTGSGDLQVLPTSTATTVLGDIPSAVATASTFAVVTTDPDNGDSNLAFTAGSESVSITFSSDIDPLTVLSGVDVTVTTESVDGATQAVEVISQPSVNGTGLTVYVASGVFTSNKLVTVTLDSTITSTAGVSLDSDYEFTFTTTYSPLYCTVRRMRLLIGGHIPDIADDTINMAIYTASLEADQITWNKANNTDEYYQFARSQWSCCRAAQILLLNAMANGGALKSKKLGDLQVDYDTSTSNLTIPLKRVEDCLAKWEGALMTGGRQVQTPVATIKGADDPDRVQAGRGWYHDGSSPPAVNSRGPLSNSRRYARGWWQR